MAYIATVFRWRITFVTKTHAPHLCSITAPDEASARAAAIDLFGIEPSQEFRLVVVNVGGITTCNVKTKEAAKAD